MSTLARKGLVSSAAAPTDGRATLISLTAAGVDAVQDVTRIERDLYDVLGMVLDAAQLSAALPVLRALVEQLPAGQALQRRIADKGVRA